MTSFTLRARTALVGTGLAATIAVACAAYNEVDRIDNKHLEETLEVRVTLLRARCLAEPQKQQQRFNNDPDQRREPWDGGSLVCDPEVLAKLSDTLPVESSRFESALADIHHALGGDAPGQVEHSQTQPQFTESASIGSGHGVQASLTEAQLALNHARQRGSAQWPYVLALLVVLITVVLPWTWYFLLRRIRELSNAIRGR